MTVLEILDLRISQRTRELNKNHRISCVQWQWLGKREILRIGMGRYWVNLDSIMKFQNSPIPFWISLSFPSLFDGAYPALFGDILPYSEMPLPFVVLKPLSQLLIVFYPQFCSPNTWQFLSFSSTLCLLMSSG